jgi:hypothetical protein
MSKSGKRFGRLATNGEDPIDSPQGVDCAMSQPTR